MTVPPSIRPALLFLALLVLLATVNGRFYFATPYHEYGDLAVNALQIDRAKHFGELYGNYSRFEFNHPGPALFYVYAWSEALFVDLLHVCPTPHNAHALAGLAVQCFFFVLGLTIAGGWIRAPLFLPLALLFGAIHFGLAKDAFISIWPPNVLAMPFFAFAIACISLGGGRGQHLAWVVLSGSVLVHAHVAQPLFVGTLFLFAYTTFLETRESQVPGGEPDPSVWRIVENAPEGVGFPVFDRLRIVCGPTPLSPSDGRIGFVTGGNLDQYRLYGFWSPDEGTAWAHEQRSALQFEPGPAGRDVILSIAWRPESVGQKVELRYNRQIVFTGSIRTEELLAVRIPRHVWNADEVALLEFILSDPLHPVPGEEALKVNRPGLGVSAVTTTYVLP